MLPFPASLVSLTLIGVGLVAAAEASSPDQSAIRELVSRQEQAWNAGDGRAWGADYAEGADFVNILGMIFHGREEIGLRHAAIFEGIYKGSHLAVSIRSIKLLAPSVALVETEMDLTGYKALPPGIAPFSEGLLRTHMKYVLVKEQNRWHIVAAQNTAERVLQAHP